MLRNFLGQPWVLVAAFIIGPTILFLIFRRRFRVDGGARQPAVGAPRPAGTPKALQGRKGGLIDPALGGERSIIIGGKGIITHCFILQN